MHHIHTQKNRPRGRAGTSSLPDPEAPCHLCWAVREAAGCTFCRWRGTSLATVPGEGKRGMWEEKAPAQALPGSVPRAGHSLALPDSLGTKPSCPNPFAPRSRSCYSASQPGKHRSRPATCAQAGCPAGTWGLELFIGVQFLCEQDSLRPENVMGVSPGMGVAPLLPASRPPGAMPYGYTFSQISLF